MESSECCVAHCGTILDMGPTLWGFLGIFRADRPFVSCFWWLGSLSNSHRPVVKCFVLDLNMLMALSVCWEVIWGSHTLICISKTHSYLQGDYYIAYNIILFIGTNYTLYHQLIHCLYTIQINQKVTMENVLNMWTPTKRYISSSYQCYIFEHQENHKCLPKLAPAIPAHLVS